MKKAFLESKWWFYIPILSYIRVWDISEWVLDGSTVLDRLYRHYLILIILMFQSVILLKIFFILFP